MVHHVILDEAGRLTAESEEARRFLAGQEGRWRVIATSADLLVLRREVIGAQPEHVRAVLCGDLGGFALGELVSFLAQARWTGVLNVARDTVEKSIFVKNGAVRWAASNQESDRLGAVVRRLGLLSGKEIEALVSAAPPGARVGQILVQSGKLDAAQLYHAVKEQVQEIFFSVLTQSEGVFFLFNDPVETRFAAQVSLELNPLLMEGLRRIDESTLFRRRIPGPFAFVSRLERNPEGLNDLELTVLEAVTGKRTVLDIAGVVQHSEFDTTKVLFGLAEAGYVEVSEARPETVLGSSGAEVSTEVRTVVRVFNTIFRAVIEEVAALAPTEGFRLGVDSFLASEQHGFRALFDGLALTEEGLVPTEALLENLAAAGVPDPPRYLYSALNELMFFELFQAGELLPPDRDEELSRRVKLLYQQLDK